MIEYSKKIRSSILGFIIGDALGVPVEFISRLDLKPNLLTDMIGYGTHNMPAGTWSDDSSMTLCTIEALIETIDHKKSNDDSINLLADKFQKWFYQGYWTPHGEVFDYGIATSIAMHKLKIMVSPSESGGNDEYSNGNGSLMRILPLIFYMFSDFDIKERFELIKKISSITHAHITSTMGCFYYVEYGILLLKGKDKFEAYNILKSELKAFFVEMNIAKTEVNKYSRILDNDIYDLSEDNILSSGYVVHSLEACIWSLLTTNTFKESLLTSINLGNDTDTIGALTGGLAGLIYEIDDLPNEWINKLAKINEIENLITQFQNSFN